jgi:hypothetical protein
MALTPDAARIVAKRSHLTDAQLELCKQAEHYIDSEIERMWSGGALSVPLHDIDEQIAFELARRYSLAKWQVGIIFPVSKIAAKPDTTRAIFSLSPVWKNP